MAEIHDFSRLYQQLGLVPGCSVHDLRMAYRRRVARLHPDRQHGDVSALQQLNILYGAALDFQRHMGRLPGAPAHKPARDTHHAETDAAFQDTADPTQAAEPSGEAPTRLRTLALLMLVLLLAALLWAAANQSLPGL